MERRRSIFDGMFDGVWVVDSDGRTTYSNGAMATLLGVTREAMLDRPMADFLHPGRWPEVQSLLDRQHDHAIERVQLALRRADGSTLLGTVEGSPITVGGGMFVGTVLNVSDETAKRVMDSQLIQRQRLEAIGEFAGGVAHDFNNLLTSIRGFTELAQQGLDVVDPARRNLDQVLASADLAGAITGKLLAFIRRQVLVPTNIDPADVIAGLVPMLRPLLGESVHLVLEIGAEHSAVRVDPFQFEQVILNLTINGRDAMSDGGTITISVCHFPPRDPERPGRDMTSGPFVRISVADTGVGIDEATRPRVFDPFFTTKAPGKGTGLGLSTVFGIVTQSDGQVTFEARPGGGTIFNVDLPRVATTGPMPQGE